MWDEAGVSHICQMNEETIQINQTGSCSLSCPLILQIIQNKQSLAVMFTWVSLSGWSSLPLLQTYNHLTLVADLCCHSVTISRISVLLKPFFVAACLVLYWTMQLDRSQLFCSTSSFDSNAQFYMWKECDWNSINTSISLIAWWENTTFGERANLGNLIRIWQSKWGILF